MREAGKTALVCLVVLAISGCSWVESMQQSELRNRYAKNEYPSNPVKGMKTVGIYVVDATLAYHPDLLELTSILHTQVQSIEGLEVLPDVVVASAAAQANLTLPRDGLKLADELKADGVFVAVVTDYSPYGEPVIAMGLVLFSRKTARISQMDIDKVIQGGKPLALPESAGTKPVTAVFDVYDASQKTTRKRIEWYAAGQTAREVGLGWERYYRTMPNFMRFASYEIVWKLFGELEKGEKNAK